MAPAQPFFGCGHCCQAFRRKEHLKVHARLVHKGAEYLCVPAALPPRLSELLGRKPSAPVSAAIPLSEVARHNTPEDCWVVLNGRVYDLTEFLDRHPGGRKTIQGRAGKDASKIFNGIHQQSWLNQYLRPEAFVGTLGLDADLVSDALWHSMREAKIVELKVDLEVLEAAAQSAALSQATAQVSQEVPDSDLIEVPRRASDCEVDADGAGLGWRREAKKTLMGHLSNLANMPLTASNEKAPNNIVTVCALVAETGPCVCVGCGYCDEAFQEQDCLKIHIRMCHDDAPYMCVAAAAPRSLAETHAQALKKLAASGIPLSEVARHNKSQDCWVAVNGRVYDLTDFLTRHPQGHGRNPVLAWAGRDATSAYDRVPGRFPSAVWIQEYLRPEALIGMTGPEQTLDASEEQALLLQKEIRRLEGPALGARAAEAPAAPPARSEEARFPRLREIAARSLRLFTRAEVAAHKGPAEPYLILHNKVYDMTPLFGTHPGGDEVLLSRAGTDATAEFEIFEHSEKARVKRDQEMLIGELVPEDRQEWPLATAGDVAVAGAGTSEVAFWPLYARSKTFDVLAMLVGLYVYMAAKKSKPLPKMMYSRALRHMHLLMGLGIFGTIGTAHLASKSEGLAKKRLLKVHKQAGFVMLLALLVRLRLRFKSAIPPRFPGNRAMQVLETQSLRLFYVLLLLLPLSGMASDYFLHWSKGDEERDSKLAKAAMTAHRGLAKTLEYAWLPFHLGYTCAFHYSKGRGVVRKVSPFI